MVIVGVVLSIVFVFLVIIVVGFCVCFLFVFIVYVFKLSRWGLGCVICMVFYKVMFRIFMVIYILEVDDGVIILDVVEEVVIDMFYFFMCCNGGCFECVGVLELG